MGYILDEKYNSLDRLGKWDEETQSVIKQRIANELGDVLSYEFLSEREGEILEMIVNTLVPQEKYSADKNRQVKISAAIDRELLKNPRGVRYGDNPWPPEFYRQGLSEFEKKGREIFGKPVEDFSQLQLDEYISKIFSRNSDDFLRRFLKKVFSDAAVVYYSHPSSWNEIGFPGPAYPEGYAYLDCGEKDNWEPTYEKK